MELIRKFARKIGGAAGAGTAATTAAAPGDGEPSVHGEGEGALVEAARRGDRGAFDTLVGSYRAQLRGFLLRRVGAEAVDDLMQEVWVASWLAMPRFQRRACFRTYLYSIAVNKCMDHHRAQSRAAAAFGTNGGVNGGGGGDGADGLPEAALALAADPAASRMRSPEELYAAAELRETVRRLIDRLPPAQREVLDLYYYAELTLPEIAGALKRNLNTVKYQFYRAHDLVGQGMTQIEGGLYEMPAAAAVAAVTSPGKPAAEKVGTARARAK
ncbi:MAG: sigma-70 family RNA polymerase sigma factor [Acetobacteraceae bacterium]|nr:sigma-70 family RNA polymerase sigma factor [Acetobacteraceae bacterium]